MLLLKAFSDIKSLRSVFANNSWVFFTPHTTLYMHLRNYRAYCVLEYNLNNHTDMDQHLLQTGKDLQKKEYNYFKKRLQAEQKNYNLHNKAIILSALKK